MLLGKALWVPLFVEAGEFNPAGTEWSQRIRNTEEYMGRENIKGFGSKENIKEKKHTFIITWLKL